MRGLTYEDIITLGGRDLAADEYWLVDHDEGPLWDTASKRLDTPIVVFCTAVGVSWEDATEQGYRLARLRKEPVH